jgi:hypothetical protein
MTLINIENAEPADLLFLVGGPRSGTTWLAHIFDSHPDVLYRHDPDSVRRNPPLQRSFSDQEIPGYLAEARAHMGQLIALRRLKAAGSLPVFPKSYAPPGAWRVRQALILLLRGVETLAARLGRPVQLYLPDMVREADRGRVRVVVKSVVSRINLRLLARALEGCRIVLILRDPYGHIASMRRGVNLGKFDSDISLEECLVLDEARQHGITPERFAAMPVIEQHAWNWVLMNEHAIGSLDGVANAMIIRYRDLCLEPMAMARRLFDFADLTWNSQTERFVGRSTSAPLVDRYYQVRKSSVDSLNKWRTQLSPEEQAQITAIFSQSWIWQRYPEFHHDADDAAPANASAAPQLPH